jgi:hypothetical protein
MISGKAKIVSIVAIIALVAGAFWFRHRKVDSSPASSPEENNLSALSQKTDSESTAAQPSSPMIRGVVWENNPRVQMPASHSELYDPSLPQWTEWKRRNQEDSHWEWKMRIDFYGKVVDYVTGQPISGVAVRTSRTDLSAEGTTQKIVHSDEQGKFNLLGVTGKRVLIAGMEKKGYVRALAGVQFGFEYAAFFDSRYHLPDPDNPVVFRMRKKVEAEPMVHWKKPVGLDPGGQILYLDLRTGRQGPGQTPFGDLMLRLTRRESEDAERPHWDFTIQGLGKAGLLRSEDEFMTEAPPDGYRAEMNFSFRQGSPGYMRQLNANYYIRLADGKTYARMETRTYAVYRDRSAVFIELYWNPSGSRNLEFDPEKIARPQDVMNAAGGSP